MALDLALYGVVKVDIGDGETKLIRLDRSAQQTTRSLGEAEKAADRAGTKIARAGNQARDAQGRFAGAGDAVRKMGSDLGGTGSILESFSSGLAALAGATVSLATAATAVVSIGSRTEDALNTLQSVTRANAQEMERVSDVAKQLGSDLTLPGTSAADATDAMVELAKGGLTLQQSMDAARGTIQLARAAMIGEAQAATITADALNTFGLAGDQATRVADLLAGSANASSGEITDMAQALAQAGAVARGASVSIEETVTAISLLAKNGIKGSDAGTSLKTFLLALQSPVSNEAADAMARLKIEAYDVNKNFKPLPTLVKEFSEKLAGLNEEDKANVLRNIFGADAIRAARIIFGEGSAGFAAMEAAVTRSGQAAEIAAAKSRGLSGAWDALKSTVETFAISAYELIDGPLTGTVRLVGSYPGLFAAAAVAVGTLVAAHALYNSQLLITTATRVPEMLASLRNLLAVMVSFSQVTKLSGTALASFALGWAGVAAAVGVALYSMSDWRDASERAREVTLDQINAQGQVLAQFREMSSEADAVASAQGTSAEQHERLNAVIGRLDPATQAYIRSLEDEKQKVTELTREIDLRIEVERAALEAKASMLARAIALDESRAAYEKHLAEQTLTSIKALKEARAREGDSTGRLGEQVTKLNEELVRHLDLSKQATTSAAENTAKWAANGRALGYSAEQYVNLSKNSALTDAKLIDLSQTYTRLTGNTQNSTTASNANAGAMNNLAGAAGNAADKVNQLANAQSRISSIRKELDEATAGIVLSAGPGQVKQQIAELRRTNKEIDEKFKEQARLSRNQAEYESLFSAGGSGGGGGGGRGSRTRGQSVLDKLIDTYKNLSSQVRTFGQTTAVARAQEELFQLVLDRVRSSADRVLLAEGRAIELMRGKEAARARDVLGMAEELDRLTALKKAEEERTEIGKRFTGMLERQADRLRELGGGEDAVGEINRLLSDPKIASAIDDNTQGLLRKNAVLIVTAEKARQVGDAFKQMSEGLDQSLRDAERLQPQLGEQDPVRKLAFELAATDIPKDLTQAQYDEIIAKRLRLLEVTTQLRDAEKKLAADTAYKDSLEQIERALFDVNGATEAQRLEYELMAGSLKELTEAQKGFLREKQQELDVTRAAREALERQRDEISQLADDLTGLVSASFDRGWRGALSGFRDMLIQMQLEFIRSKIYKSLEGIFNVKGDASAQAGQQGGGINLGALFGKIFNRKGNQPKDSTAGAVRDASTAAVAAVTQAGTSNATAIEMTGDATVRGLGNVSQNLLSGLGQIAAVIAAQNSAGGFWKGFFGAAISGFLSGLTGGLANGITGRLFGGSSGSGGSIFGAPGGTRFGNGGTFGNSSLSGRSFSTGGSVFGAGTSTSDSIPAMLSNGEYVLSARAVRQLGIPLLDYMNAAGRVPVRLSTGGAVTNYTPAAVRSSYEGRSGAGDRNITFDVTSVVRPNRQGRVQSPDQITVEVTRRSDRARRNT
jgi:TP901 family phage tail tape measure protein